MKILLICIASFGLIGCATEPNVILTPEDRAHIAATWVADKSGLIEAAVQGLTQAGIYGFEKDSQERAHTIAAVHVLAANLNALVNSGRVDPDSIRSALDIKEEYIGGIIAGVEPIIANYITIFQKNGYADLTIEIVKAVSKGMEDATAGN